MSNAIRRPDHTFVITVNPVYDVYPCGERMALESRGLFGFHYSRECPNCLTVTRGWEFWGENGHRQGGATTRAELAYKLRYLVMKQWRSSGKEYTPAGSLIGMRVKLGDSLYYQGDRTAEDYIKDVEASNASS